MATVLMATQQEIPPVLWLSPRGELLVAGQPVRPKANGVVRTRALGGYAYSFAGPKSGILLGDLPPLRLTGSMTVATWINPRSYVDDGPGAQILFRGDDRSGLDPYTLVIHGDGTVNFGINDEHYQGMSVSAELPLNRWSHVAATFSDKTGELNLFLNGERVAYARTSKRPFATLDAGTAPGVSIGNVQNDQGPHNQPFHGMLADLRLYPGVLTPEQAGYGYRPGLENGPVALRPMKRIRS